MMGKIMLISWPDLPIFLGDFMRFNTEPAILIYKHQTCLGIIFHVQQKNV